MRCSYHCPLPPDEWKNTAHDNKWLQHNQTDFRVPVFGKQASDFRFFLFLQFFQMGIDSLRLTLFLGRDDDSCGDGIMDFIHGRTGRLMVQWN